MPQGSDEVMGFIVKWTPRSDVYSFLIGANLLPLSAALSAAYINLRFRRALKMRNFAYFTTMGGVVLIPTAMSTALHAKFTVEPLLLRKQSCPVCLDVRSGLMQVSCGVLYPLLLSPIMCFMFANSYMTVAIPPVQQPMLLLQKYVSIVKPLGKRLLWMVALHFVIGDALAAWQRRDLLTVMDKVSRMEETVAKHKTRQQMADIKQKFEYEESDSTYKYKEPAKKYIWGDFF